MRPLVEKPTFKFHIKAGDTVKVISGDSKGRTGTVLKVDRTNYRAIIEGLNMVKKHRKPTAQDPQSGGIIEIEAPIHLSNLMLVDPATGSATKTGRKLNPQGKSQRFSKTTGQFIADGNPKA
jgi:large subunit ribosomal protein L24